MNLLLCKTLDGHAVLDLKANSKPVGHLVLLLMKITSRRHPGMKNTVLSFLVYCNYSVPYCCLFIYLFSGINTAVQLLGLRHYLCIERLMLSPCLCVQSKCNMAQRNSLTCRLASSEFLYCFYFLKLQISCDWPV